MDYQTDAFIRDFLKEIREDNAAIFAGAGLSADAGFVNWRELLRPVAEELRLDIDKESDLIAVAQYHYNEHGENRHVLNQLLIEKMTIAAAPTENHRILARLPIGTYWTTNYDQLIETALKDAGKISDVKYVVAHLANTKTRRDAVIYKMHGDVQHPHDAVLIKDDYEKYHIDRGAFVNALSGHLVSKTFLFLGFSFTDPNLDYILSRVRVTFRENQRRHYCILKQRVREAGETEAEFEQAQVKQRLAIDDLKRFNIKTLLVNEYPQITAILSRIERQYRQRTVFISGSADEYGRWSQHATEEFLRDLSRALVAHGYRIATGVGAGVGDAVISGAIEQIYNVRTGHIADSLVMRPFPRNYVDKAVRKRLWEAYRQDLISTAGICLFLLGNKRTEAGIVLADGMRREFEIAREHGLFVVPVGASGYMAQELWKQVTESFDDFYPGAGGDLRQKFLRLGETVDHPAKLTSSVLEVIAMIEKE